jgi:hypothetical protein
MRGKEINLKILLTQDKNSKQYCNKIVKCFIAASSERKFTNICMCFISQQKCFSVIKRERAALKVP